MFAKSKRLSSILTRYYGDNSRYDIGVPSHIMRGLDHDMLLLSDAEISDDDVVVLARFLQHAYPLRCIRQIHVKRTSDRKVIERRPDSALTAKNSKLLKELYQFIRKAQRLESITFESVKIPKESFYEFGKALTACNGVIRWLGFKSCDIGSDDGLRILTPFINKLNMQVLGFEQCELTDLSLPYIASILKAQQNHLDCLYWNATLRMDPSKRESFHSSVEIDEVYRSGLVAFSIAGNHIVGQDIYRLTRILRDNYWLLGLNFADNRLTKDNLTILANEMLSNSVLQSILLKGNPGYDLQLAHIFMESILHNTHAVPSYDSTALDGSTMDLEIGRSDGFRRIGLQPTKVTILLHSWKDLQKHEVTSFSAEFKDADVDVEGSFSSWYSNKTRSARRERLQPPVTPIAIGYSMMNYISTDLRLLYTAPESPYRRDSKRAAASPTPSSTRIGPRSSLDEVALNLHGNGPSEYRTYRRPEDDKTYRQKKIDVVDSALPNALSAMKDDSATNDDSNTRYAIETDSAWDVIGNWPFSSHHHMQSEHDYAMDGRPPSRISLRPRSNLMTGDPDSEQSAHYLNEDTVDQRAVRTIKKYRRRRRSDAVSSTPIDSTRIVVKKPFVAGSIRIKKGASTQLPKRTTGVNNSSDAFISKLLIHHRHSGVSTSALSLQSRGRSRTASPLPSHIPSMRSSPRFHSQHDDNHVSVADQTTDTGSRANASSMSFIRELSATVLSATKNLEHVSRKLRDVTDSLSTSMELNISIQKDLTSSSMMNNNNNKNNNNTSFQSHHDDSSSKAAGRGSIGVGSPVSTHINAIASPMIEDRSGSSSTTTPFVGGTDMLDLIKSRMQLRLRDMLTS